MNIKFDNPLDSKVFLEFSAALDQYITSQDTEADRKAEMPAPPWPTDDNVMLEYLLHRARELILNVTVDDDAALKPTFVWLAVTAWFEGGLAERGRARQAT